MIILEIIARIGFTHEIRPLKIYIRVWSDNYGSYGHNYGHVNGFASRSPVHKYDDIFNEKFAHDHRAISHMELMKNLT